MKRSLLLIISLISIFGCSEDHELKKSVFIIDTKHPNLPAYSEWGYNTFGAYYDRIPFISSDSEVPAKIIVTNDETTFVLKGQRGARSYYSDPNKGMSITFKIPGILPENYTELMVLNLKTIDLSKDSEVLIKVDSIERKAQILEGKLEFKRAQNLLVDTKQVEVILSGYFEFKALINNDPITISEGRFDVGIGADNFYNY